MVHIVMHVGDIKAGSTALQCSLKVGAQQLRNSGFVYDPSEQDVNHVPLGVFWGDKYSNNWEAMKARGVLQYKILEACARRGETIIISSEKLLRINPEEFIPRLRKVSQKPIKITLVAYIRDPVTSYLSVVQQILRGQPGFQQPDEFKRPLDRFLEKWCSQKNVTKAYVREFSRSSLIGGDIVSDFAHILSKISGQEVALPQVRANESLSAEEIVVLDSYRNLSPGEGESVLARRSSVLESPRNINFMGWFREINRPGLVGQKPKPSRKVRVALEKANFEIVQRLNEVFPDLNFPLGASGVEQEWVPTESIVDLFESVDLQLVEDLKSLVPALSPQLQLGLTPDASLAIKRCFASDREHFAKRLTATFSYWLQCGCERAAKELVAPAHVRTLVEADVRLTV